ncbi:MAG: hypothetical protein J5825_12105 [Lachnospiraceae bacterium]|nr:hypothetical protein [Lachnospiraceae bacterium]
MQEEINGSVSEPLKVDQTEQTSHKDDHTAPGSLKDVIKTPPGSVVKRRISILAIPEILILLLGVFTSLSITSRVVSISGKHAWYYLFAVLGVAMILFLIKKIRMRFVWVVGFAFIVIYLIVAGSAAMRCELDYSRIRRVLHFDGREVTAEFDGKSYRWDGENVSYDIHVLDPVDDELQAQSRILVDGIPTTNGLYRKEGSDELYMQIYGGATGIFLVLEPE